MAKVIIQYVREATEDVIAHHREVSRNTACESWAIRRSS
jgi:hypothetical protein